MNPKRIDKIDYAVITLYVTIGLFIYLSYNNNLIDQKYINSILIALTFAGPLLLFMMYYKRYRILYVWLIWIVLGILQLLILSQLRTNIDFKAVNGTYADSSWNLLIMVLMVGFFRLINIVIFKQEFVVATKFSDQIERKFTPFDYGLFLFGFLVLTIGTSYIYNK